MNDLMKSPREYVLEQELKEAKRRIYELSGGLEPDPYINQCRLLDEVEISAPVMDDVVTIRKQATINWGFNEYGAFHVVAKQRNQNVLDYYCLDVRMNQSDTANFLARSHLDFVMRLGELMREEQGRG